MASVNVLDLPEELLLAVFRRVSTVKDLYAAACVCARWKALLHGDVLGEPWAQPGKMAQHPLQCVTRAPPGASGGALALCELRRYRGELALCSDDGTTLLRARRAPRCGPALWTVHLGNPADSAPIATVACQFAGVFGTALNVELRPTPAFAQQLARRLPVAAAAPPALVASGRVRWARSVRPTRETFARVTAGDAVTALVHKASHWNEELRCWCLNFRGRAWRASVKNFQLVVAGHDDVVLSFGRRGKDTFCLDFDPKRLSALQALALALTCRL
jgi:hypothetical protein